MYECMCAADSGGGWGWEGARVCEVTLIWIDHAAGFVGGLELLKHHVESLCSVSECSI